MRTRIIALSIYILTFAILSSPRFYQFLNRGKDVTYPIFVDLTFFNIPELKNFILGNTVMIVVIVIARVITNFLFKKLNFSKLRSNEMVLLSGIAAFVCAASSLLIVNSSFISAGVSTDLTLLQIIIFGTIIGTQTMIVHSILIFILKGFKSIRS